MQGIFDDYIATFVATLQQLEATSAHGQTIGMGDAMTQVHAMLHGARHGSAKVMFVGNGGSAGIAGHMAIDFAKNGGVRAVTFNDAASLTCLGNDLGYEQVFAKQVEMQALPGDILLAISSSGESKNILRAVEAAGRKNCAVLTLSGFAPGNALRRLGAVNFYVKSSVYGFVETAHQTILHAILDLGMGWTKRTAHEQPQRTLL
jgi:D-sedoheptulose 7-phosphate isomerase